MNYDELINSSKVVLVEFFATWCGHCKEMEPVVEQVKELLAGHAEVYQLDVDKNTEAADKANITGTPTFILYKDGRQVWRHSGEVDGTVIMEKAGQAING